MSKLYELLPAYLALQDAAEEGADVSEALAQLEDDLELKALSIVHVRNSLRSDSAACKAEADRLYKRAKMLESQADRMDMHVLTTMRANGVTRIKAPTVTISIAQCPERIEITDEQALPAEFWREKVERSPDKTAIKAHVKECGEIPPGVRIERSERLQVK